MITRYFTFVNADLECVSDAMVEIIEDPDCSVKRYVSRLFVDLSYVRCNAAMKKMVLWSPCKNQTAIYGNQRDGFYTLCNILNLRYGYDITRICLTLDPENKIGNQEYDIRLFYHWGRDHSERMVRVMQDPHWDFYEIGEPFPFEQTEKYKERIKKKRLTNDMILDYAEAMGYDVRNPEFWKSDNATYLEWSWIPVTKQNKQ